MKTKKKLFNKGEQIGTIEKLLIRQQQISNKAELTVELKSNYKFEN